MTERILICQPSTAYKPAPQVDFSHLCGPLAWQDKTKLCIPFAITGGCSAFVQQALSERFNYVTGRAVFESEGGTNDYPGVAPLYALMAAAQYGLPSNASWPFNPDRVNDVPPQPVYDEAALMKLNGFSRINATGAELSRQTRWALARGMPVIYAGWVGEKFADYQAGEIYSSTGAGNPRSFKHGLLLTGYGGGPFGEWFHFKDSFLPVYGKFDTSVVIRDAIEVWVIEGFNGVRYLTPDQNLKSDAWLWADAHQSDVRRWVVDRLNTWPQEIIDKAVEIGASREDLTRWMLWSPEDVPTFLVAHPELDSSQWL